MRVGASRDRASFVVVALLVVGAAIGCGHPVKLEASSTCYDTSPTCTLRVKAEKGARVQLLGRDAEAGDDGEVHFEVPYDELPLSKTIPIDAEAGLFSKGHLEWSFFRAARPNYLDIYGAEAEGAKMLGCTGCGAKSLPLTKDATIPIKISNTRGAKITVDGVAIQTVADPPWSWSLDPTKGLGDRTLAELDASPDLHFVFASDLDDHKAVTVTVTGGLPIVAAIVLSRAAAGPLTFDDADAKASAASPPAVALARTAKVTAYGKAIELRDVDRVAIARDVGEPKNAPCGPYGVNAYLQRLTFDEEVTIVDRRSGKEVAKKSFAAPTPGACPEKITATMDGNGTEYGDTVEVRADKEIAAWVAGFAK